MLELEQLVAALQHMDQSAHHSVLRQMNMDQSAHHSVLRQMNSCVIATQKWWLLLMHQLQETTAPAVRHPLTRIMST